MNKNSHGTNLISCSCKDKAEEFKLMKFSSILGHLKCVNHQEVIFYRNFNRNF